MPEKLDKDSRLLAIVFGTLGFVALVISGLIFRSEYDVYRNSVTTDGVVIHQEIDRSDGTTYRPTIRYLDEQGEVHQAQTRWKSSGYDYEIGEQVEIRYDRRALDKIRIPGWLSSWGIPAIPLFIGLGFLFVPYVVWAELRGRKLRRKDREARKRKKTKKGQS